ncbi:hypothetical protein [Stenotrophomonas maltophilia]|uniref:hypothetical protein n=1 Tax=Stenotrophomonas maltophilia TaxID=40324 RepID=UPI00117EC036|nr:hypothetical protein [Stenotrophomonas maltophilia]
MAGGRPAGGGSVLGPQGAHHRHQPASFCASLARPGEASAVHEDADTVQQVIGLCRLRGVGRHPFERHRSGDQVIDLEGQAGRDGIERGRGGVQRLGGV